MITAHNARSTRRRGSSSSGKKLPERSFGIPTSTSPPGVDSSFGRCPLRRAVRSGERSPGAAPIKMVSSASINSCSAAVRMSRSDVDSVGSVPASRPARSDRADSELVIVRLLGCSVASENRTVTTITPRTGAASYTT
jgi:hypothetical protein